MEALLCRLKPRSLVKNDKTERFKPTRFKV